MIPRSRRLSIPIVTLFALALGACPRQAPPPAPPPARPTVIAVTAPRSDSVRVCGGRRARTDVDVAIAHCVQSIQEFKRGASLPIVGPGCAELFSAKPCRDAWYGLAAAPSKAHAVQTLARACAPAYCEKLPEERPKLCGASVDEVPPGELDDDLVALLQASIRCDYSWNPDAERFVAFVELFRERPIESPQGVEAPPPAPALHLVTISVEAVGKYRVTIAGRSKTVSRRVTAAELESLVQPLRIGPETKVVLRADGWTPYAVVLATMTALSDAGFIGVELTAAER